MKLLSAKFSLTFLLLIIAGFPGSAQKLTLSGEWHFALDPLSRGEQNDWHLAGDVTETNGSFTWIGWDIVKVPQCRSVDNRYNHIVKAWYKKGFKLPGSLDAKTARLQFEAVFYRCRIFINGTFAGAHEGGYTPFEIDATAYQMGVYRNLDNTRLLTFIGHGKAADVLNVPHDSFRYCDFLNINIYSPKERFAQIADDLHQKYPEKPIFISEFGQRADQVENEEVRSQYLRDVISILRERPFIVGCSYWSYNDYKSRFVGTNPVSGSREWGIVDAQRKPRGIYATFQSELSSAIVTIQSQSINVQSRTDFPSFVLKGYQLKITWTNHTTSAFKLKELSPGQNQSFSLPAQQTALHYELMNPKGFVVARE